MKNFKIAIFTDAYRPKIDGVSISCENITREFDSLGIDFDLYAPETPGDYTDPDYVKRFSSVPIAFQPELRFSFPIDRKILSYLIKHQYDAIHSNSPGSLGFVALEVAKSRNIPHFHTFHTFLPDYTHYIFGGKILTPQMVTKLMGMWCNWMDYLIAPSVKIHDWMIRVGIKKEIRIIPSGINTARFDLPVNSNYFVEQGYCDKDDFKLLFVGRFGKEKAIDTLIKYFGEIPNVRGSKIKLLIVGDGPPKKDLEQLTHKFNLDKNVIFTGYCVPSDIYKVYKSADVFTLLSTTETQGMVVTEAIASGLPVILANDQAYTGMIEDGANGFSIDSENEFIEKVLLLSNNRDLVVKMGHNSLTKAIDYDISHTTKLLLEYYQHGITCWNKRHQTKSKLTMKSLTQQLQKTINEIKLKLFEHV